MHFGDQNVLCSETNQVQEKIQREKLKKKIQYKSNQNNKNSRNNG
jgi:hypothetical protein